MAETISRNRFIRRVLSAWGVLTSLPVFYVLSEYIIPPAPSVASVVPIDGGLSTEYDAEPVRVIREGKRALIVIKGGNDQFRALSAKCTHLGCIVEFDPTHGEQLKCNCHGSTFDLQGNPTSGPASKPLQPYRVEVKGDRVTVTVI